MPNASDKSPRYSTGASYAFYTGLAFQMGAVIGLLSWGGVALDSHWETGKTFTLIGSLGGVFIALYLAIKSIITKNR
jgi:hypothetical protein